MLIFHRSEKHWNICWFIFICFMVSLQNFNHYFSKICVIKTRSFKSIPSQKWKFLKRYRLCSACYLTLASFLGRYVACKLPLTITLKHFHINCAILQRKWNNSGLFWGMLYQLYYFSDMMQKLSTRLIEILLPNRGSLWNTCFLCDEFNL